MPIRFIVLMIMAPLVATTFATQGVSAENGTAAGAEPSGAVREGSEPTFPEAIEDWRVADDERERGLVAAEKLRRRVLARGDDGRTGVAVIAEGIGHFQEAFGDRVPDGQPIDGFRVTADRLRRQLRGNDGLDPSVFDPFTGRWYGRWDEMLVNHDWRATEVFDPRPAGDPSDDSEGASGDERTDREPGLLALQYAWISNGFGWNYLASLDDAGHQNVVLGMVYYLESPEYRRIVGETPLVGFADGPTRLVWITEQEIYLEEVFRDGSGDPRYVITGMTHDLLGPDRSVTGDGVQAIYTRDPSRRPAFRKFTWSSTR